MAFYSTSNNQTTREIYNIIDNIEEKISNRNKSRKKYNGPMYQNYSNYIAMNDNPYNQRPQINSFINDAYNPYANTNQSQVIPQNLTMNKSTDLDVRAIVKEELNSVLESHQKNMNENINLLQNKINDISDDYKKENIKLRSQNNNNINKDSLLNEVKKMLLDFVSLNDYNKKIKELEDLIYSNQNNINAKNNSMQSMENKFDNEIKKINQNLQENKFKYEDLSKKFNNFENKYNNFENKYNNFENNYNTDIKILKQNCNKILENESNLNDIMNKNKLLQSNLDLYREDISNFKNGINSSISKNNEKMFDIENKQNNINNRINDFDSKHQKINEELNKINNDYKNMIDSIKSEKQIEIIMNDYYGDNSQNLLVFKFREKDLDKMNHISYLIKYDEF